MIERRTSRSAALRRLMERRRVAEADVRPRRMVSRNTDGTANVMPLDGECVENGGLEAQAGVIFTPSTFHGATVGTAPGTTRLTLTSGALRIDGYEPRQLTRGQTVTVRLTGSGFVPSMVVDHVREGDALYPGLSTKALTVLDTHTADMDVIVAPDAPLGQGGLAYDAVPVPAIDGETAAGLRYTPAFDVVPSRDYRWVAWFDDGSRLTAVELDGNGVYGAEAGRVSSAGFSVLGSSPIPRDPSAKLGRDAAVWTSGSTLYVVDPRAGSVATHHAASGRRMAGACLLTNGRLGWIEWTPGNAETCAVSLWSADTDFADATEDRVGHARHAVGGGIGAVHWIQSNETGFAPASAGVDLQYQGPNGLTGHTFLYFGPGTPQSVPGYGSNVGIGMPHPTGSIAGSDRWSGDLGGEGFPGFVPFLDFEAPPRGAVGVDGSLVLYDPGDLRLVEIASPLLTGPPSVDIHLQPHPTYGVPVRVVPGGQNA